MRVSHQNRGNSQTIACQLRNKESPQASHWRAGMECFYSLTQPKSRLMSTTQPGDEGSQGLSLFGVVSAWLWAVLCVMSVDSLKVFLLLSLLVLLCEFLSSYCIVFNGI